MTNTPKTEKGRAQVRKMDTGVGGGRKREETDVFARTGNSSIEVLRCRNSRSNAVYLSFMYCVYRRGSFLCIFFFLLVCSLRKHPFLLALRRWGRFARRKRPQRRRAKRNGCFRRPALFASCYLWRVRVGDSIL